MTGYCLCGELNRYLEQLIRFSLDMPVMGQFIKEAVLSSRKELQRNAKKVVWS